MMNWKPRVRSESEPIANATSMETRIAIGQATNASVMP